MSLSYKNYQVRKKIPDLNRSAMLVIDMQEYFSSIASTVLENINSLIEKCREKKIPIIFTQHGHRNPKKDAGMLFEWWGDNIIEGSPEHRLIQNLSVEKTDTVIKKMRYDAFRETELNRILKKQKITDLIITGVMTNLCCETTARAAFVRDYRVFFMIDGTATSDPELHNATLANLAYGFAYLNSCDRIQNCLCS